MKRKEQIKFKQEQSNIYNIKMPVYTTRCIDEEDELFDKVTYGDMIAFIKSTFKIQISIIFG